MDHPPSQPLKGVFLHLCLCGSLCLLVHVSGHISMCMYVSVCVNACPSVYICEARVLSRMLLPASHLPGPETLETQQGLSASSGAHSKSPFSSTPRCSVKKPTFQLLGFSSLPGVAGVGFASLGQMNFLSLPRSAGSSRPSLPLLCLPPLALPGGSDPLAWPLPCFPSPPLPPLLGVSLSLQSLATRTG